MSRKGEERKRRAAVAEDTLKLSRKMAEKIPRFAESTVQRTVLIDIRRIPEPAQPQPSPQPSTQPTAAPAAAAPTPTPTFAAPAAAAAPAAEPPREAKNTITQKSVSAAAPRSATCEVVVSNEDTLNCAARLCEAGHKDILILNLASERAPGGGWLKGSLAQEEELFLRTTLGIDLGLSNKKSAHPYDPSRTWKYPLGSSQIIYTPAAAVIKDDRHRELPAKERFIASFLAVPAVRTPKLIKLPNGELGYKNASDEKLMADKVEAIFRIAAINGHKTLVLGALGCGCFENPNLRVANLFREALDRHKTSFNHIEFAILDENADLPDSNFAAFHATLAQ